MYLAPRWALSAQAIDAATDPRLARGVHVRAMPSGRIGLPLAPLVVYRVVVAQPSSSLFRTDVRWLDSHGAALSPSFAVTPDNPVSAWLPPPPAACCWLEVLATPTGPGLQVDAIVSTRRGPAVVATRRANRYIVAASHIEHVVVRGSGTVTGVRWIEASSIVPSGPWRQWSLPVSSGPRYVAATGADNDAKSRVLAGAPSRRGLYEDPRSGSAATAPPVTPNDEWTRVEPLTSDLRAWLQRLTHDTSASPDLLTQSFTVSTGATTGTGAFPILAPALQAALDPGLGRWVGFSDVDAAPPGAGAIVFYLISGVWQLWPHLVSSPLLKQMPPGAVFDGHASDPAKRLPLINVKDRLDVQGPCAELWAVAAASIGVPCDPPAAPDVVIGDGPWMPSPPAMPVRQVPIDVSSMTAAALLAFARDDGGVISLNPVSPSTGKPLPLFASPPRTSRVASAAHVEDRTAPPGVPKYRIAQADWFGRWSPWRFASAASKPRTAPPRPTLEVFYAPASASAVGLARGRLTLRVAIPDDGALPPGCEPLRTLALSLRGAGGFSVDVSFPVTGGTDARVIPATHPATPDTPPAPTPALLEVGADGPALDIGGVLTVEITARWTTASRTSAASDPIRRDLRDVRPIPPPPIPSTLRYTERPDARGRAHFEIDLPATSATYRVFYADENQLRRGLGKLAAGGYTVDGTPAQVAAIRARAATAAADLSTVGALGAADRAARFVAYADAMTYDMFQNLTPTALAPSTFAHDLSGSLTALSFYRVVTFNASGVPSDFTSSPIVPVAVRSEPPPARPMISVTGAAPGDATRARITVRVPRTQVDAAAYRVRRSSVAATPDPRQMMVIHEGALPDERDEGRELVVFEHLDEGPLKPWRRYAWAVEVRAGAPAGAPPGSTLVGDYGPPSAPATLAVVPAGPPEAIAALAAMRSAGAVHLSWTAPDARTLIASDMGAHRFDLYRVLPGQIPQRLAVPSPPVLDSDGVFRFVDTGAPATAVSYRIVVVDPLGRSSRPSATKSLP